MRALDDVEVLPDVGRDAGRVAGDDAELFVAIQQVVEDLAADLAGGGGDDDHGNLQGMIVMRIAITLSLNASSLCLDMVYPGDG